jgi:hypothetical protein
MATQVPAFDPIKYKETSRQQWQSAAEAWHRWGPTLRAWLGPAPGQPGPFSFGAPGVLGEAGRRAGIRDADVRAVPALLCMASAAERLRLERESFGALRQMLAKLAEAEREAARGEIAEALGLFEGPDGFAGPCELVVGVATK